MRRIGVVALGVQPVVDLPEPVEAVDPLEVGLQDGRVERRPGFGLEPRLDQRGIEGRVVLDDDAIDRRRCARALALRGQVDPPRSRRRRTGRAARRGCAGPPRRRARRCRRRARSPPSRSPRARAGAARPAGGADRSGAAWCRPSAPRAPGSRSRRSCLSSSRPASGVPTSTAITMSAPRASARAIGRLFVTRPSTSRRPSRSTGANTARDRHAGADRAREVAVVEDHRLAGDDVGGDRFEGEMEGGEVALLRDGEQEPAQQQVELLSLDQAHRQL